MKNETFKKKISDKILQLLTESKEKIKQLRVNSKDRFLNHEEIDLNQYKKIVSTNVKLGPQQKINTKISNKPLQKLILKTEHNKEKKGLILDDLSKNIPNNLKTINPRSRTIKNPYKIKTELTQNDERYSKSLEKLNTEILNNYTLGKIVKTRKYQIVNENNLNVISGNSEKII
jgi:hypothetical protein